MVDYLYFNRPVMYVTQDIERAKSYVNEPGRHAYDAHYAGANTDDVERFVNDVVLAGHDTMLATRQAFYDEYLARPGGQSTAKNIYDDMLRALGLCTA